MGRIVVDRASAFIGRGHCQMVVANALDAGDPNLRWAPAIGAIGASDTQAKRFDSGSGTRLID
jgi:hypothetical protein